MTSKNFTDWYKAKKLQEATKDNKGGKGLEDIPDDEMGDIKDDLDDLEGEEEKAPDKGQAAEGGDEDLGGELGGELGGGPQTDLGGDLGGLGGAPGAPEPDMGGPEKEGEEEEDEEEEKEDPEKEGLAEVASGEVREDVVSHIDKEYGNITLADVAAYFSQKIDAVTGKSMYSISDDESGIRALFGEIGVDDPQKKVSELENEYKASGEDMWAKVAINLNKFKINESVMDMVLNKLYERITNE